MESSSVNGNMFQTTSGHKLACEYWTDEVVTSPRALVFICHGVAGHCRRYDNVVKIMNDAGCYVFAHDHLGHGKSEGERVHVVNFKHYVDDLFEHIDGLKKRFPADTKVFIIAHSMGGAIAVLAAMRRPEYFAGVVLISAAFEFPDGAISPFQKKLVNLTSKLFSQFQFRKIDPLMLSRDHDEVKSYQEDPLVWHGGLKAKWFNAMCTAMNFIRQRIPEVAWPFLAMHGTEDQLTSVEGSKNFHAHAGSEDKTLKLYEGYYHQLHLEPEPDRTEVCRVIRDWIVARLV